MNIDPHLLTEYALSKNGAEECFPFGDDTFVYKLNGKIFMLLSQDDGVVNMNLKCDPEEAVSLREQYPGVIVPGYHMNKKHWNTVHFFEGAGLKFSFVKQLIDNSYDLVKGRKK